MLLFNCSPSSELIVEIFYDWECDQKFHLNTTFVLDRRSSNDLRRGSFRANVENCREEKIQSAYMYFIFDEISIYSNQSYLSVTKAKMIRFNCKLN